MFKSSFHSAGEEKTPNVFDGCGLNPESSSDSSPEWQHPCGAPIHPKDANRVYIFQGLSLMLPEPCGYHLPLLTSLSPPRIIFFGM